MPYTPPSQRSPAATATNSPQISRRPSYQPDQISSPTSSRPELPRSTSYLTRHRRTPSVKTASFAPSNGQAESTPPGTADRDNADLTNLMASGTLRESPPPLTDGKQMPAGAILSPPESTQNSSDDEEDKSRGRQLENLAELQAAIRIIEQHRSSSPTTHAGDVARANKALTLVTDDKPTTEHMEKSLGPTGRKILHVRSNTDSSVFIDLRQDESTSVSDEDSDDEMGPRRKPPMLRKKSGELVRPALRPPSRRRPSSMPGTPTFSKAVHFDSHLEHVRHFLQVDRPLAVSAGSSPVESYESDTEYPFDDESSHNVRSPPFEWEIVVANFPSETPERLNLPVRVEKVFLSTDNKNLIGTVAVANVGFQKTVIARFTLDYWKTTSEVVAEFNNDVRRKQLHDGYDRFNFNIKLADQANLEAKTMFFCVKYHVNGQEYWDNNNNINFQIDFRKKAKPQNGKRGLQGAASRPANGLPRSNKKPLPVGINRPRTMPVAFDDFADGFDSKYDFKNFALPVNDFLGDSANPPLRLKGVKSAVSLAVDDLSRKAPSPNGQAFSNRYSFGASMKAAMKAAGVPAPPQHKSAPQAKAKNEPIAAQKRAPTSGSDSPRPAGVEKPVLASQSYNELLDKYCFFGSVKSSPQLKDGTLGSRSGQYDGNDDGYVLGSRSPSPPEQQQHSPLLQIEQPSTPPMGPESMQMKNRSTSPAPMTGFVTGTSYARASALHGGFPFNVHEAHSATAIRG